jgi:hypothetical protein
MILVSVPSLELEADALTSVDSMAVRQTAAWAIRDNAFFTSTDGSALLDTACAASSVCSPVWESPEAINARPARASEAMRCSGVLRSLRYRVPPANDLSRSTRHQTEIQRLEHHCAPFLIADLRSDLFSSFELTRLQKLERRCHVQIVASITLRRGGGLFDEIVDRVFLRIGSSDGGRVGTDCPRPFISCSTRSIACCKSAVPLGQSTCKLGSNC